MKSLFISILLMLCVINSNAQTDEAMIKWLNNHLSAINITESSSQSTFSSPYNGNFTDLYFDKYGVKAIGVARSYFNTSSRKFFKEAIIENNDLVLKERSGGITRLRIADPSLRLQFKEVLTRWAYTRYNTNEADLPIYDSSKVDKTAAFPGGSAAWQKFLLNNFSFDPTVKHNVPAGTYKALLSFVVSKDSVLKDFKKISNHPKGVDEAFLRVMLKSPPWIPATFNGQPVSTTVAASMIIKVNPRKPDDANDLMEKAHVEMYYRPLDVNMFNYETSKPGYEGLKPLILDEKSNTPPSTIKKNGDEKQPVVTKIKTTIDVQLEKWIIEPVTYFESIGPFKEGLASVSKDNIAGDDKRGYINTDGKIVVPLKYDEAQDFSNGLACVSLNGKTGFINRNGKVVVPFIWDAAESFSEGLAVVEKNGKSGCIDTTGKIVLSPKYANLHQYNDGLIAYEDNNGKWGFIDRTGKIIIEPQYEGGWGSYGIFINGLCLISVRQSIRKYGFIKKDGKETIGFIYDEAKLFSEGLVAVRKDKKYGYINKEGETVIPFDYDYAYSFENGIAQVKQNERYGFINKKGEVVTPIRYLGIISSFREGIAQVMNEDRKYGFINEAGKEIITPKYDEAGSAKNGLICVALNGRWGYIDVQGNTIIPMIYELAYDFIGGLASVKLDGKFFLIDRAGKKWVPKK